MTTPPSPPTTIITSHLNADFDAVASALAASKMYPGAKIVFPGSQERGIRDFMVRSASYLLDVMRLRDVNLSKVKRLVVVDTRQRNRLGVLGELVDRPEVEVVVYDHHPPSPNDIQGVQTFFQKVGSNTTLMVQLLRERGLAVTPDEATLLALGIYEDTGSFTFASTTSDDFEAAAWLLRQEADINAVSELLSHRLTPQHVALLNDLLETAATYTLAGVPIVVAKTAIPGYVEDFAILVHELMDIEKLTVVFALAFMEDRVLIVGRSREERVDVGEVLKALGGGGHPMAASATLKSVTLAEAEERLLGELRRQLGAEPRVRDVMSYPVLSVTPETPFSEVHDDLTRYGVTVLPVVTQDHVHGYISRRTVEKAIYHGLEALPVREYMTADFRVVHPDEPLSRVQDIIVQGRQRFVPVVENGRIVGVMTRSDLLQILSGDPARQPEPLLAQREQKKNVASLLRDQLPKRVLDLLVQAGEVATRRGFQVYVVGGFVRDLLLREPNLDIDLVVEGDGIALARELAERFGARVRAHKKFGTAIIIFPDGFRVDAATARWEYYEYPAAMPTVALSSIKLDLYRRDFTINTLAIKLNSQGFGILVDFFGGQRDLKDRTIRVLHSLSFVEDPTRVFRAIRFEQRYGFQIGKHTLRLIQNAVRLNVFSRLSGPRLLGEIRHILDEADPRPALRRLDGLGLLKALHPHLALHARTEKLLSQTQETLTWYKLLFRPQSPHRWLVYLLALADELAAKDVRELARQLGLSGREQRILTTGRQEARTALALLSRRPTVTNKELYWLLKTLHLELILYLLARAQTAQARQALSRYITELEDTRPLLGGEDLKEMGFSPGPIFRTILHRLQEARLNKEVQSRHDEIALVTKEFRQTIADRRVKKAGTNQRDPQDDKATG